MDFASERLDNTVQKAGFQLAPTRFWHYRYSAGVRLVLKVTFSFLLIDLSRTTVLLELDRITRMAEDDCNLFSA